MEQFWSKVTKGEGDGCWEWNGRRHPKGYGQLNFMGKPWRAHRFAWSLVNGDIPEGMFVCHRCDNPSCVRLDHLFLGTNQDNMDDMVAKGRGRGRCGVHRNHRSKLTAEQVISARKRHPGETYRQLAAEFGVELDTMRNAVRGFTWKHLNHLAPPGSGGPGGAFRRDF